MAAVIKPVPPLTVALLGRPDSARESLRRSLEDLGAEVVFEGDPAGIEAGQVLQRSPRVVVVNLASGVEDDIDHLQSVFDDPAVNVVFNEADVSSQLAGWDLARWARHLASKITGSEVSNPPPPPGAKLLPTNSFMPVPGAPRTPAQMAPERAIEEFMIEAEDLADEVPTDHLPLPQSRPRLVEPVTEEDESIEFDLNQVEGAMGQDETRPALEQTAVPEPDAPSMVVLEDDAAEFDAALDLDALDEALAMRATPSASSGSSDSESLSEALSELDRDLDAESGSAVSLDSDELVLDSSTVAEADGDPGDLDAEFDIEAFSLETFDTDDDDDKATRSANLSQDAGAAIDHEPADDLLDDDVAALAASLDALDASSRSSADVVELSFDLALEDDDSTEPEQQATSAAGVNATTVPGSSAVRESKSTPETAKESGESILDRLELALLDDDDAALAAPAASTPAAPAYDFSGLDMSLEPTEEEIEELAKLPKQQPPPEAETNGNALDDSMDALLAAMDLSPGNGAREASDLAPGQIPRVLVLGASIGGPDAVRTFLSAIPKGFPALIVLVQHLENGFFERLAQQLQKSTKLSVRVPDMERPAMIGEVLVVSAEHRLRIESDGVITLAEHAEPPRYTPCIDEVLRDIADEFGPKATAIIFSGMAGDAIEGAVYLTTMGGEVWAQDPTSCVVSSMVDGAQSRGVVEFVGSPRDLAEHCIAKFGRN